MNKKNSLIEKFFYLLVLKLKLKNPAIILRFFKCRNVNENSANKNIKKINKCH